MYPYSNHVHKYVLKLYSIVLIQILYLYIQIIAKVLIMNEYPFLAFGKKKMLLKNDSCLSINL